MKRFSKILKFLCCGAVLLVLASCLPESKKGASSGGGQEDQAQTVAREYATELLTSATKIQNAVLTSTVWKNGTLTAGPLNVAALGVSVPDAIQAAYCQDLAASPPGNMLFIWMTSASDKDFALKGLGFDAGSKVVRSLGGMGATSWAGLYDGQAVNLMSARQDGAIFLNIPSSCAANLAIPAGAPVLVMEQMTVPEAVAIGAASFEYKTESCPAGEIGNIMLRRQVQFDSETGEKIFVGSWQDHENTCTSSILGFDVQVNKTTISALNQSVSGSDVISGALKTLQNMECSQVSGSDSRSDSISESDSRDAQITVSSCENTGGEGTQLSDRNAHTFVEGTTLTGQDTLVQNCSVGDLSPVSGGLNNIQGVITFGSGWVGTVSFKREYIETLKVDEETGEVLSSEVNKREVWVGEDVNCSRDESLLINCASAYPAYTVPPYTPVNTGGFNYSRTNTVQGWQDPEHFVPGTPQASDADWSLASASCSWMETQNFDNCAAGFTPQLPVGTYERLITASDVYGNVTLGSWTVVQPSLCVDSNTVVTDDPAACPVGYTGFIRTITGQTSTADFPWDTPVVTSSTITEDHCVPPVLVPVDGVCGSTSGSAQTFSSPPTTGLCSAGTAINMRLVQDGSGVDTWYNWECAGADGGVTSPTCSAGYALPSGPGACLWKYLGNQRAKTSVQADLLCSDPAYHGGSISDVACPSDGLITWRCNKSGFGTSWYECDCDGSVGPLPPLPTP